MNKKQTVLISGAGIGGLTLAYWLTQYDYDVTIVERAATPRDGGYAVDVRGPAIEVIQKMGLLPEVREKAIHNDEVYVNEHDKVVAEPGKIMELFAGYGETADAELMRGDLLHVLNKAIAKKVQFMWNNCIQECTQDALGAHVTFMHGAPRTFNMVVGADGLHSNVRRQVFGDKSEYTRHLGYYVSLFTIPNYLNLQDQERVYRTSGKLAGMYTTPKKDEAKAIFYFASPKLDYDFRDIAAQKRIVAEQFKDQSWEVPRLLTAMETAPDFYFDSISQITLDKWSKGRVALLGDAAYCASPLSGQGTSLALVGAYVLAGELKAAGGDYSKAFSAYEEAMREFVRVNQKSAASSGKQFIPSSRFQRWFGDVNIRLLPRMPWRGAIVKMFRGPFDAIALKKY